MPAPDAVLAALLPAPRQALMLGHVHPDADVLGTLLALGLVLEERGSSVSYGGPHPAPQLLAFLPGIARYRRLERVQAPVDLVVLTDCPNPARTEGLLGQARAVGARVLNIDHHPDNRYYGDVNWIEPAAAATGEMVYDLLVALGARITPAIATNLFTAIHVDTGSFRYSNVTPTTFRIASELVAAGADPARVSTALYEQRPAQAFRWLGESLARIEVSADGRVAWLSLPSGLVPESFVEAEDLVNYPRSIGSVRVACLLRERDGLVKVSLRGKGDVDVSLIAARFGGGGHRNAAGCTVAGPLDRATRDVLAAVRAALEGTPGDMSRAPLRSGVLVVDKVAGATSFDVVALVRRRLNAKRVGHAGTLDPGAVGVLPILVGEATKLMPYLAERDKEYVATIRLGVTTDTQDLTGRVLSEAPVPPLSRADVAGAARAFVGPIRQVPPMYSAVRREGRRLYELARAGVEVPREPRPVEIHAIEVEDLARPRATLRIVCGKGVYVRTLAADLGALLGCGAALERLVRTRVGPFTLSQAIRSADLAAAEPQELWTRLLPADAALAGWPAVHLADRAAAGFLNGQAVAVTSPAEAGRFVPVYGPGGGFLGVGELIRDGRLKPARILHADHPGPRVLPA